MSPLRRFAFALLLLPAACGQAPDSAQLRLCRLVLPALHPPQTEIRILRTSTPPSRPGAVRIDYAAREPDAENRIRRAVCLFEARPSEQASADLIGVETDQGPLGPARFFFLKRYWLPAAAAEPPPNSDAAVPSLPPAAAYGLQQAINALAAASSYALLATAYSLIYGLIGRINLAFGALAVIGAYAAFLAVNAATNAGLPSFAATLVAACLAGAGLAALWSAVLGRLIVAPLHRRHRFGQPILVATIAAAIVIEEGLRLFQGARERWLPAVFNEPIALARADAFVVTVTPLHMLVSGAALAASCAVLLLIARSRFGREWRAFADDPGAAALFGVAPARLLALTFALAGALAGLAGWITTVYYGAVSAGQGTSVGLKALISAVIGGIGSLPGAFIGGVLVGVVETFWSAYFELAAREIVLFGILIAVLMLKPAGFFGRSEPKPHDG